MRAVVVLVLPPPVQVDRRKNVGEVDTLASRLRSVHVDQIYPAESANSYSPALYRVLVVIMSIALIATVVLGLVLAFRSLRPRWPVWLALASNT